MPEEINELHLLYRPQTFDEYIGNDTMKQALINSLDSTRTFLMHGDRGCGKTTLARLIAYSKDVADSDIHEIDAASKTSVDDMRQLIATTRYAPKNGKAKMYIIDECHRLSGNAWDSLLKTLEEPPRHCYFGLCTTSFEKVPKTIQSRAKCFEVKPLMKREAERLISWVCENEGINLPDSVKNAIMAQCEGIPREIVIAIDLARGIPDEQEAVKFISARSIHDTQIIDLCQALLSNKKWKDIAAILSGLKDKDPESIRYAVLGYMNAVLLKDENGQAWTIMEFFKESFMYTKHPGLTHACYAATH